MRRKRRTSRTNTRLLWKTFMEKVARIKCPARLNKIKALLIYCHTKSILMNYDCQFSKLYPTIKAAVKLINYKLDVSREFLFSYLLFLQLSFIWNCNACCIFHFSFHACLDFLVFMFISILQFIHLSNFPSVLIENGHVENEKKYARKSHAH